MVLRAAQSRYFTDGRQCVDRAADLRRYGCKRRKLGVLTSYRNLMGAGLGFGENKPDERVSLVSFGCVKSYAPSEGVE